MPIKATRHADGSKKIGIIAGTGDLPFAILCEAQKSGYEVVAIALQPPADESLKAVADDFYKIRIGKFGSLLSLLKKLNLSEVVMAGKVPKKLLYENKKDIIPDLKALKMLFSLKDRRDDTIMSVVVKEIEKKGIKIHQTIEFTKELLATVGVLTQRKPTKDDIKDIEFGFAIAKKVGRLDIGQTIVVKNMAVMAVEAIEGTDEAIKRGGKLAENGAVVVKVSKPQQDMRFDVPTVGIDTLRSMMQSNSGVLALEAGKCIIVDKQNFLKEADKSGIIVVGVDSSKFENK